MSNKYINYQDDCIVDPGCSNHMTGDKNKLQSMTKYKGDRILMTNDYKMQITHIGNTIIAPRFSPHWVQLQNAFPYARNEGESIVNVPTHSLMKLCSLWT